MTTTTTARTIADVKVGDRITINGEEGIVTFFRLPQTGMAKGNAMLTISYDECRAATIVFHDAKNQTLEAVAAVSA